MREAWWNPPKNKEPYVFMCLHAVAAGCWFWHHFERLRCCLIFEKRVQCWFGWTTAYETYRHWRTITCCVFQVCRSLLHGHQPRIPSQPLAKPWLFWRRDVGNPTTKTDWTCCEIFKVRCFIIVSSVFYVCFLFTVYSIMFFYGVLTCFEHLLNLLEAVEIFGRMQRGDGGPARSSPAPAPQHSCRLHS